jgi:hypothetical protein
MRTLWVCDITGGPQHYVATVPGRRMSRPPWKFGGGPR